jgi:primary-amine oxidase
MVLNAGELHRDSDLKFKDPNWAVPDSPASEPQDLEDRMAPINIPAGGKRYTINSQTYYVRYLGWDFFLSWRRETGLSFWNLKFRGDSVLYELSMQEASASYSMASDPAAMNSQLLDRFWGLGAASTPLIEGYDCPYGATFLNSNFYMGERSYRAMRNVCIFEMDLGRPMSRHSDRATARSTRGAALIVRWMATVGITPLP